MTVLVSYDLTGVTTGTTLVDGTVGTGDTSPDVVNVGGDIWTCVDDATQGKCFSFNPTGLTRIQWSLGSRTSCGIRFYVNKLTAWSSVSLFIAGITAGAGAYNTNVALAGTGAPGQVRISPGVSDTRSGNGVIALDSWWRIEAYYKATQYRLLAYSNNSTTAAYDSGWVAGTVATHDIFAIGSVKTNPSGTANATKFAHLKITDDADTLIGPWGAPSVPAQFPVKHKNSSAVVAGSIKGYWNGTTLKTVNRVYRDGVMLWEKP